ncbi:MerR family transcriptional regulator [Actinoplanes sp. M2I2]|uniref:MerR family transcriptional regulator n=1 Tax=Actinoplanes sp. M2I2 TaxID=1734444 RepID=UPI002021400E|nr:MerR family transcriptional regulator [Actinoplanes sp. M2I2]
MRIGRLAALARVTSRTVRHYHQIGLLPEPERRSNGYREYTVLDLTKLLRIRHLVALGLPLDRIPPLLDPVDGGVAAELAGLEHAIRRQIGELTRQLDVVVAARASVLPEASAGFGGTDPYGEAAEEARAALGAGDLRRIEADLTLLIATADEATRTRLHEHVAKAWTPAGAHRLAQLSRDLVAVTDATPEAERERIARELRDLLPDVPELFDRTVADLLDQYSAEAFTSAQLDVLRRAAP